MIKISKSFISILILLMLLSGCSSSGGQSNPGTAEGETASDLQKGEIGKKVERTIPEKFRTNLGALTGLTTKGQRISVTTKQAVELQNKLIPKKQGVKQKTKLSKHK